LKIIPANIHLRRQGWVRAQIHGMKSLRKVAHRPTPPPWKKRKNINKTLHAVVLIVFTGACWFLSLTLKLPSVPSEPTGLPAFTRLCMTAGPFLLAAFVLLALSYCLYVWVRKAERQPRWIGFLATTTSALLLVVLPTVVAIYLPLVEFLNRSTALHLK